MTLLIKNGHVIDAKTGINGKFDILIEEGRITEIGKDIDSAGREVIDAAGKHVLPGFVDAHCHLRDPGLEYKEDIASGSRSAAVGGFTSIACMPNTNPVMDNESIVKYVLNKARNESVVNIFPIGAITKGQKGDELSEIGELKHAGAIAISDDGKPVGNSLLMKKALEYSAKFDIRVISHCEDLDLADGGVMNEGDQSAVMGLKGIPAAAEEIMVARDLILSEYTNTPIHIAHVSTELAVDLIRNAKKRGVRVTAETCPHYFSLTDKACDGFNMLAKVNPPLRTQKDVDAVIQGLRDGTIDIIATDHAPHHADEKNVEFNRALSGMVGFETAFPLAVTYLVKPGLITLEQLVEKMCVNPPKMLGIGKGTLEIGKAADLVVVDVNEEYTVNIRNFSSRSKNSPFHGYRLNGIVHYTIVNGKVVVREKKLS